MLCGWFVQYACMPLGLHAGDVISEISAALGSVVVAALYLVSTKPSFDSEYDDFFDWKFECPCSLSLSES